MSERSYLDRVVDVYQRVLYRAARFDSLARRAANADRRDKWRVLEDLERASCAQIAEVVRRHGLEPPIGSQSTDEGRRDGELASRHRWIDCMDLLASRAALEISHCEQLGRESPDEDADAWARVTAHQVAAQSFHRLELIGRPGESILPAQALLARETAPVGALAAAG